MSKRKVRKVKKAAPFMIQKRYEVWLEVPCYTAKTLPEAVEVSTAIGYEEMQRNKEVELIDFSLLPGTTVRENW